LLALLWVRKSDGKKGRVEGDYERHREKGWLSSSSSPS